MEDTDSEGKPPKYRGGDKVFISPLGVEAKVVKQILHHDSACTFWGNVEFELGSGERGVCNGWQVIERP